MSKRLILVLCILISLGACAAFDSDAEPYVGFAPDEVPVIPGANIGIYNGYYDGAMTVDFNDCIAVSDAVGDEIPLALDVLHSDNALNITFEDGTVAAGDLVNESAIFLVKTGDTKHVYYLDFTVDDAIGGSCEVIEAADDGSYGPPCASYTISLEETEKPAEEEDSASEDEAEGDEQQSPFEEPEAIPEEESEEDLPTEIKL